METAAAAGIARSEGGPNIEFGSSTTYREHTRRQTTHLPAILWTGMVDCLDFGTQDAVRYVLLSRPAGSQQRSVICALGIA